MPNGEDEYYHELERKELAELREQVKQLRQDANVALSEENDRLIEQVKRLEHSAQTASFNIIELSALRDMMSKSLAGALALVESLMSDLRHANVSPGVASVVAKTKFDYELRQILAKYGSQLPSEGKPS